MLVDLRDTRSKGPLECENLRNNAIVECEKTSKKLMDSWFPEVASVFYENKSLGKINAASFYECVDTLVSNELKALVTRTFMAWIALFDDVHMIPVFKLQLVLDEDQMQFYPSLDELENVMTSVVSVITNSLQTVPKMQGWITTGEATGYVDVSTEKTLLDTTLRHLVVQVRKNLEEPKQHLESYGKP